MKPIRVCSLNLCAKIYLDRAKLISISTPKIDVEEIKEKLKTEIDQQNRQLQVLVNSMVTENMDLKRRIGLTEEKLLSIEKQMGTKSQRSPLGKRFII